MRARPVTADLSCPACRQSSVRRLWALPAFPEELEATWRAAEISPGSLFACSYCSLRFRSPTPPEARLLTAYESMSVESSWVHGERPLWHTMRRLMDRAPGRSVLDVGCFRGDFLAWLGGGWERFGIEPSPEGQRASQARGVTILGSNVTSFEPGKARFAVITLVDVVEHLPHPLDVLERLSLALVPGGSLLVFTGDTEAMTWRLAGRHYWYSLLPEHVVFLSSSWFRWAAPRLGCHIDTLRRLAHSPKGVQASIDEAIKNVVWIALRRLGDAGGSRFPVARLPLLGRMAQRKAAWWTTARDHILVQLVRNSDDELER